MYSITNNPFNIINHIRVTSLFALLLLVLLSFRFVPYLDNTETLLKLYFSEIEEPAIGNVCTFCIYCFVKDLLPHFVFLGFTYSIVLYMMIVGCFVDQIIIWSQDMIWLASCLSFIEFTNPLSMWKKKYYIFCSMLFCKICNVWGSWSSNCSTTRPIYFFWGELYCVRLRKCVTSGFGYSVLVHCLLSDAFFLFRKLIPSELSMQTGIVDVRVIFVSHIIAELDFCVTSAINIHGCNFPYGFEVNKHPNIDHGQSISNLLWASWA